MKAPFVLVVALCLAVTPVSSEDRPSSGNEVVVLDAPGGRPVAVLLSGASRRLGEEREGFVRVTVEGWIRLPSEPARESPAPGPPFSKPTASEPSEPILSGQIKAPLPSGEVRYGAGARIVILGSVPDLEARRQEIKSRYGREEAALETEIESLRRQESQSLNSSDNFTQAARRSDRLKAQVAAKTAERKKLPEKYALEVDELFRDFQVAETTADPGGRYSFTTLPPGSYRLLAVFSLEGKIHRWYLPLEVSGPGGLRVDLDNDNRGTDPYFVTR
jgi:hypothetical protein